MSIITLSVAQLSDPLELDQMRPSWIMCVESPHINLKSLQWHVPVDVVGILCQRQVMEMHVARNVQRNEYILYLQSFNVPNQCNPPVSHYFVCIGVFVVFRVCYAVSAECLLHIYKSYYFDNSLKLGPTSGSIHNRIELLNAVYLTLEAQQRNTYCKKLTAMAFIIPHFIRFTSFSHCQFPFSSSFIILSRWKTFSANMSICSNIINGKLICFDTPWLRLCNGERKHHTS